MKNEEWPEWAKPGKADEYGNAVCKICGKIQSPAFSACIYCCAHEELELLEEWQGADEGGVWGLAVECSICGKNFDFDRGELIRHYKVVLKTPKLNKEISMTEKREVETWLVKDTDGEYVTVRADNWECGGNGLKFFVEDVKVAHFVRWCSYRKLSA